MQLKSCFKYAVLLTSLALPLTANAAPKDFDKWLKDVRQDALNKGISKETVKEALSDVTYLPRVIELDRKQPEGTMTFSKYIQNVLPQSRVDKARKLYQQNKPLLEKIGKKYGVQPRFIVALWGIESNFGENMGGFSVVDSLATLAHDGRRSKFFRSELMNALKIIDQGHISATAMKGSWAGAMGQTQFMPSSFNSYAVDYDGDGKKDIWSNKKDAFASIANYLSNVGWDNQYTWGRQVDAPVKKVSTLVNSNKKYDLQTWNKKGVKTASGKALPIVDIKAHLVKPGDNDNLYYLAYHNFDVVLRWNRSKYFATAVGLLSDKIK